MPCADCHLPDDEMPSDTVLTGRQWEMICPEGGVLCANCIVKRASRLPHMINVCLRIIFVDDYHDDDKPGGKFWQYMKSLDAEVPHAPR